VLPALLGRPNDVIVAVEERCGDGGREVGGVMRQHQEYCRWNNIYLSLEWGKNDVASSKILNLLFTDPITRSSRNSRIGQSTLLKYQLTISLDQQLTISANQSILKIVSHCV
jgi:hypothetical protein